MNESRLILIKILHTAVWAVMASASIYILYAGLAKKTGTLVWLCIGLLIFEVMTLLLNKWACPLTPIAMRYTQDRRDNFDIYLPVFVARYNKIIFGGIFLAGTLLVLWNMISK